MIRKATVGDMHALKAVRSAVAENVLSEPSKITDDQYSWFIQNPGIFVWEEQEGIVGFSAADPRSGNIWALFVAPEFERRGIGRQLLNESCRILKDARVRRAWLTTEPGTRAEQFYRVAGWAFAGMRGDELLFELDL